MDGQHASGHLGQSPPQREMVYCHECENEWYRDEHGLSCPECMSDFTEIIETDHDPRLEQLPDHDDELPDADDLVSHHPLHDHNPWSSEDDPEEQDVSTLRWQRSEPGRYTATATIYRSFSPSGRMLNSDGDDDDMHNRGYNGDPLARNFLNMITGIMGGGSGAPPQHEGRSGQQDASSPRSGPTSPNPAQEAPRVDFFSAPGRGGTRFTYHTTARVFPRDANSPQPHVEPVDELSHVIGTLMMGIGGPGGPFMAHGGGGGNAGGNDNQMPNPLAAIFASILNPGMAAQGDFVYTQEALDRVISQLMEQNATGNAPGPASANAIASLPKRKVTLEDLGTDGRAECSICMDEVNVGDEVTVLPCTHWFHQQCIGVWLGEHDTCPHCRKGITPEGQSGASGTDSQHPPEGQQPSGGPSPGAGTETNPFIISDSPERGGQSSSAAGQPDASHHTSHESMSNSDSAEGAGGIGDRIRRTLFGPGR